MTQMLFHHETRHTAASLVMLMQSRSYYLSATEDRQRALEHDVDELAQTHPDLAGRAEFTLPYVTVVFRAVRRSSGD